MTFWDFLRSRAEDRQKRWEVRQLAKAQKRVAAVAHQRTGAMRIFAMIIIAIITAFIIATSAWHTYILAGRDWCSRALGAAKYADGPPEFAIGGCFALLNQQVEALAWNSHIYGAAIALCLLALMVIVVAGGRLSFKAGKDGLEGNMGREDAAQGAQEAADAAQDVADAKAGQDEGTIA